MAEDPLTADKLAIKRCCAAHCVLIGVPNCRLNAHLQHAIRAAGGITTETDLTNSSSSLLPGFKD